MARCPECYYESNSFFGTSSDKYICKQTGIKMDVNDPKAKYVCDADYGEEYEKCPIYQSRK